MKIFQMNMRKMKIILMKIFKMSKIVCIALIISLKTFIHLLNLNISVRFGDNSLKEDLLPKEVKRVLEKYLRFSSYYCACI